MKRTLLKSKIHRATVTEADLHYDGSITVDEHLLEAADLIPFEQVQVYDVTNGSRLTTYVIPGPPHSGTVCINGAAAHLVQAGDLVIIAAYGEFTDVDAKDFEPRIVLVDEHNRPRAAAHVVQEVPGENGC